MANARVKMRVARLRQEMQDRKEERVREFQLRRELELMKLEFELELKAPSATFEA